MAVLALTALENDGDGVSLQATLDRVPTGTLSFYVSTLPGELGDLAAHTGSGTGPYEVTASDTAVPGRFPVYVTARDSAGDSEVACEWLAYGDNHDLLSLVEDALQDILLDNQLALNRALKIQLGAATWQDGSNILCEKISRGLPVFDNNGRWPVIAVRVNSFTEDPYFANPSTDYVGVTGSIYCYLFHQTKVPHEQIVEALGMAVLNVLNQNVYRQIPLDNGLCVYESLVERLVSNEVLDQDVGAWFTVAELTYKANVSFMRMN